MSVVEIEMFALYLRESTLRCAVDFSSLPGDNMLRFGIFLDHERASEAIVPVSTYDLDR